MFFQTPDLLYSQADFHHIRASNPHLQNKRFLPRSFKPKHGLSIKNTMEKEEDKNSVRLAKKFILLILFPLDLKFGPSAENDHHFGSKVGFDQDAF